MTNKPAAQIPIRPFRTPVRGHAFASPPPASVGQGDRLSLLEGQAAALVREPGNPRDPFAVAVWVRTAGTAWRIGYLDRAVAARVAPRMDRGTGFRGRITGTVSEPDGRWSRPLLLVEPDGASGRRLPPRQGVWGRPPASVRRVVAA